MGDKVVVRVVLVRYWLGKRRSSSPCLGCAEWSGCGIKWLSL